jgi:hypothetical protein
LCSEKEKQATDTLFQGENTGINFDAYEDIPVEVGAAAQAVPTLPPALDRAAHSVACSGRQGSRRGALAPLPAAPACCWALQVSGQDAPEGISSFEDVDLPPALMENVKRCKYTKPTPVQVLQRPCCLGRTAWHAPACCRRQLGEAGLLAPVACCSAPGAPLLLLPRCLPLCSLSPACRRALPRIPPQPPLACHPPTCSATPSPLAWPAAT